MSTLMIDIRATRQLRLFAPTQHVTARVLGPALRSVCFGAD